MWSKSFLSIACHDSIPWTLALPLASRVSGKGNGNVSIFDTLDPWKLILDIVPEDQLLSSLLVQRDFYPSHCLIHAACQTEALVIRHLTSPLIAGDE